MTSPPHEASRLRSTWSLPVFVPGILILVTLLAVCSVNPDGAERFFLAGQRWVAAHFSWFYLLAVAIFSILLLVIAASRYGSIRLGADDTRPEFSFTSWLAMLFAAGMGIGLLYFGVAEPMMHYTAPPLAPPGTPAAAREAMTTTFFHWGFHAWSVYALVGLVLAPGRADVILGLALVGAEARRGQLVALDVEPEVDVVAQGVGLHPG